MIDRFGKPLSVGWSETEIIWLEAALTLKGEIKFAAFRDISEMSGRSYGAVLAKAANVVEEKKEAWIAKLSASKKMAHVMAGGAA